MEIGANRQGLASATLIKIIALFFMTLDHLGAYGFELPVIRSNTSLLRLAGRIAAPLFLFFVVESMKHTKDRKRLLVRLYCAAMITGVCNAIVAACFSFQVSFGNIYQSYVWVICIILLLDKTILYFKNNQIVRSVCTGVGGVLLVLLIHLWDTLLLDYYSLSRLTDLDIQVWRIVHLISRVFVFPPRSVEYSVLFLALGVIWYYQKSKAIQCVTLFVFCVLGFCGIGNNIPMFSFIAGNQWVMIGAIIPILLYNGKYGSGYKYFFYIYYPVHGYVIAGLQYLYLMMG